MDEFHFYSEPDRGWAWQVPLLELTRAQFVLMSATLGDISELAADLTRRNGRATAVVDDAERPVPLIFSWAMTHLADTVAELIETHQAPVYVVHFTQAAAVEHATSLLAARPGIELTREARDAINERLVGFRFGAGFGKTLHKLVRRGIGVHHAGMLPRYRRLVEQLAQSGPAGRHLRHRHPRRGHQRADPDRAVHRAREVRRHPAADPALARVHADRRAAPAAPASTPSGYVVVQAPEHVIDNAMALAKVGDDPKKQRSVPPQEAARRRGRLVRGDLRQAGRGHRPSSWSRG